MVNLYGSSTWVCCYRQVLNQQEFGENISTNRLVNRVSKSWVVALNWLYLCFRLWSPEPNQQDCLLWDIKKKKHCNICWNDCQNSPGIDGVIFNLFWRLPLSRRCICPDCVWKILDKRESESTTEQTGSLNQPLDKREVWINHWTNGESKSTTEQT